MRNNQSTENLDQFVVVKWSLKHIIWSSYVSCVLETVHFHYLGGLIWWVLLLYNCVCCWLTDHIALREQRVESGSREGPVYQCEATWIVGWWWLLDSGSYHHSPCWEKTSVIIWFHPLLPLEHIRGKPEHTVLQTQHSLIHNDEASHCNNNTFTWLSTWKSFTSSYRLTGIHVSLCYICVMW
jgi:hypothetical protein